MSARYYMCLQEYTRTNWEKLCGESLTGSAYVFTNKWWTRSAIISYVAPNKVVGERYRNVQRFRNESIHLKACNTLLNHVKTFYTTSINDSDKSILLTFSGELDLTQESEGIIEGQFWCSGGINAQPRQKSVGYSVYVKRSVARDSHEKEWEYVWVFNVAAYSECVPRKY